MIEVYNVNNQKLKCEVLFKFEKYDKNFIVYKDNEDDILASYYIIRDDKLILLPISDEKDYDVVDIELEKWWNQNGE